MTARKFSPRSQTRCRFRHSWDSVGTLLAWGAEDGKAGVILSADRQFFVLEVLDCAFVRLCFLARGKSAEVAP